MCRRQSSNGEGEKKTNFPFSPATVGVEVTTCGSAGQQEIDTERPKNSIRSRHFTTARTGSQQRRRRRRHQQQKNHTQQCTDEDETVSCVLKDFLFDGSLEFVFFFSDTSIQSQYSEDERDEYVHGTLRQAKSDARLFVEYPVRD